MEDLAAPNLNYIFTDANALALLGIIFGLFSDLIVDANLFYLITLSSAEGLIAAVLI
jgi:hypothetical protein